MHGSIPHVTILPGMPPGDDFKFSFFSQLAVYSPTRGTGRTGLVMNHNYFCFGRIIKNNNDDLRTVGKRGV